MAAPSSDSSAPTKPVWIAPDYSTLTDEQIKHNFKPMSKPGQYKIRMAFSIGKDAKGKDTKGSVRYGVYHEGYTTKPIDEETDGGRITLRVVYPRDKPQTERFKKFQEELNAWHLDLGLGEKREEWHGKRPSDPEEAEFEDKVLRKNFMAPFWDPVEPMEDGTVLNPSMRFQLRTAEKSDSQNTTVLIAEEEPTTDEEGNLVLNAVPADPECPWAVFRTAGVRVWVLQAEISNINVRDPKWGAVHVLRTVVVIPSTASVGSKRPREVGVTSSDGSSAKIRIMDRGSSEPTPETTTATEAEAAAAAEIEGGAGGGGGSEEEGTTTTDADAYADAGAEGWE